MRLAHLAVGDRSFYLPIEEVEHVMADAAQAQEDHEWLEFLDAGGEFWRLLVPEQTLLVIHEVERETDPGLDTNDWFSYDYDL